MVVSVSINKIPGQSQDRVVHSVCCLLLLSSCHLKCPLTSPRSMSHKWKSISWKKLGIGFYKSDVYAGLSRGFPPHIGNPQCAFSTSSWTRWAEAMQPSLQCGDTDSQIKCNYRRWNFQTQCLQDSSIIVLLSLLLTKLDSIGFRECLVGNSWHVVLRMFAFCPPPLEGANTFICLFVGVVILV